MSYANNIIAAPVSISDVQNALGSGSTDLGTLCMHNNINKWAKYKPISYATVGLLTNTVRAARNFGLSNIPTWSDTTGQKAAVKMCAFWFGDRASEQANAPECGYKPIYWEYRKPEGGSASPFRLADFSEYPVSANAYGYWHIAPAPIASSGTTNYTASGGTVRINYNASVNSSPLCIHLEDLIYPGAQISIANMYFGVMFKKVGTTTYYGATQSTPMSQLGTYNAWVDIPWNPSMDGSYEIFPFCSNQPFTFTSSLSQVSASRFVALMEKETVGIGTAIVTLPIVANSFSAYYDLTESTRNLYCYFTLDNTGYTANLNYTGTIEVFNSDGTLLKTEYVTGTAPRSSYHSVVKLPVDMGSSINLRNSYSMRLTITPSGPAYVGSSFAVCDITNGPSRN